MLGAVVHATMQTTCPMFFQCYWGNDYQLNDWSGTYGAATFFKDGVVGTFYDVHSRHTWEYLMHNQESFFSGMPTAHRVVAEQFTLQYLLQERDGRILPIVTAVFWNQGAELVAAVHWKEMMDNGGHILRIQFLDTEPALVEWQEGYQMTPAQVDFVRRVFKRRMAAKAAWIELTAAESQWLQEQAESAEAMTKCRQCFAEVGIFVPCLG
jgi:hypothetical protein